MGGNTSSGFGGGLGGNTSTLNTSGFGTNTPSSGFGMGGNTSSGFGGGMGGNTSSGFGMGGNNIVWFETHRLVWKHIFWIRYQQQHVGGNTLGGTRWEEIWAVPRSQLGTQ